MHGCKVAVIGGGPAGTLCAAQFAKRGARVTVYEPRSLQEQTSVRLGWPIALGNMGTDAIEAADLSSDFGATYEAEGTVTQPANGPQSFRYRAAGQPGMFKYWVTRATIVAHLRAQCEAVYGDLVTFEDGYSLVGGNLPAGDVVVQKTSASAPPADGDTSKDADGDVKLITVHADLVVGADGAGSLTRSLLQQQDTNLKVERVYTGTAALPYTIPPEASPDAYSTLATPSGATLKVKPDSVAATLPGAFSIFFLPCKDASPEVTAMIVSWQGAGKVQIGALSCLSEWFEVERTEEELRELLEGTFPCAPRTWLHACAASAYTHSDRARRSSVVQCSTLGSGRCVLIGDAAHNTPPAIGTGAASAMQDTAILANVVDELLATNSRTDSSSATVATPGLRSSTVSAPPGAPDAQKSSVTTMDRKNPVDTSALAGIAHAWTKARGADASALGNLNRSFVAVSAFKGDPVGNAGELLRALPLLVPQRLATVKSFPGKEWLAIPQAQFALLTDSSPPSAIEQEMRAAFNKVLGATVALLGAGAAFVSAAAGLHT